MSARDELARALAVHTPVWDHREGRFLTECGCGDFVLWGVDRAEAEVRWGTHLADAVLSEWLPTLADDEAVVDGVTRIVCAPALEPAMYLEFTREHLRALATTLSPTSPAPVPSPQSSPASDGPGETVPGAGEHDGHPGAPSPASGGPSSGGAA